jgi:flavin reductase (DIM6/NTAB) family NADH-FMN oxidoreductase RutF
VILNTADIAQPDRYKLLIGAVVPRPIAWVSSMSANGVLNLAPFSFFTVGATVPMTLLFCPQMPGAATGRGKKDTLRNIEAVPEFVINIASESLVKEMNLSATELPYGHSEFDWAGVTPASSEMIRVPRVAESPISFECKLQQIVTISDQPGGGAVVFGEVQCVHVRDDVYDNGRILLHELQPLGRLAGAAYARVTDTFDLPRVPAPKPEEADPK